MIMRMADRRYRMALAVSRLRRGAGGAVLIGLLALAAPSGVAAQSDGTAFAPGKAAFTAKVNGVPAPYDITFARVMPGDWVTVRPDGPAADYRLITPETVVADKGFGAFAWRAPERPGYHTLTLARDDGARLKIRVFVMVPAERLSAEGRLGDYEIGRYPRVPLDGREIYERPEGFIKVTRDMADVKIAPHFTLGQFLCKQQPAMWPKYVLLRPLLLMKLEFLLQAVNERGWRTDDFHIMSGYRTPAYNAELGNVAYSRHVWGGAADIYIDARPEDGMMDDLNGDGRIDRRDAARLYEFVDRLARSEGEVELVGGLGAYGATSAHGPFIHVDVRGDPARWGQ